MKIQLIDNEKLGGRTGAKAAIYVAGVLLCQWAAIGLLLAAIWGIQHVLGSVSGTLTCTLILLASLALTFGLFSRRGIKYQHRRAEQFESFLTSIFSGRQPSNEPISNVTFSLINGDFGRSESPYPPPPKNHLA